MFTEPHWLMLILPLLWLVFKYRPDSSKVLYLRVILVILLCVALAGPMIKLEGREGVVMVVADRSASMPYDNERRINETVSLLREKMPTNGQLGLISFSDKAKLEFSPSRGDSSALSAIQNADASNMSEALDLAVSLIPTEMSGRILLLSDGLWNGENPSKIALTAAQRGIPIDFRYYSRKNENDLAISYFKVPTNLEPGEGYIVRAGIIAPFDMEANISLFSGEREILNKRKKLNKGSNEIALSLVAPNSSLIKYKLEVAAVEQIKDPIPENNYASAVSMVKVKKPLLVVCEQTESSIKMLLDSNKIAAEAKKPHECSWRIEDLSAYSGVVLENVPAEKLGYSGMSSLAAWVKHMGGGLFVTGGKNSYGNGGYYNSPLDDALPVSMELRSNNRKMSMSMVIVMDRSGSMAAMSGGRTKMELADIAAASSLDLLSPLDEFGLFAVDTKPHVIVPLQSAQYKEKIRQLILSIRSEGGGIYVYEGIKAAIEMLEPSSIRTRHIILFADACDSEEPGQYWKLLGDAVKNDTTLSVIGLGKETDPDANLLKKIAEEGKGRCFFTSDAEDLPRLFSQDTFIAAKSTFITEPIQIMANASLNSYVTNTGFVSSVNAYNLCYLKSGAAKLISLCDDEENPLLATWQYGLGHVACYMGVVSSKQGGDFAGSEDAASVFSAICDWIAYDDRNSLESMMVTQKANSGKWTATIHLDPERTREPFEKLPEFKLLGENNSKEPKILTILPEWKNADELVANYQLKGNEVISALLHVNDKSRLRLAPVCQIYSPEYAVRHNDSEGLQALKDLANLTKGKELIDLASIWNNMPPVVQNKDISDIIFGLALVIFLLEIAERRTAVLSVAWASLHRASSGTIAKPVEKEDIGNKDEGLKDKILNSVGAGVSVKHSEEKPSVAVEEKNNVLGALKRAKKNASHRTGKN